MRIRDDVRDPAVVSSLFSQVHWANERTRAAIEAGVAHTDVILTAWQDDACVGMLRALTDHTFRAFIEDVIIDESTQGQGYGTALVEAALKHPDIANVEAVYLCSSKPGFYERLGFVPHSLEVGGWMVFHPGQGKD